MTTETQLRDIPKTCNGLFLWVEQQRKSFDLQPSTATNWVGSCKKLFAFDEPGWEQKDPSEMDLELLCNRAIKAGLKSITVSTYRVKAKECIKNFTKFLENPSAYKPPTFKKRNHSVSTSEVLSLSASASKGSIVPMASKINPAQIDSQLQPLQGLVQIIINLPDQYKKDG